MRGSLWLAAVLCALVLSAAGGRAEQEELDMESQMPVHPQRIPGRSEDRLEGSLSDRAALLFRAMDKDHDKLIGEEDVRASLDQLQEHMPGVGADEFISFMQFADRDGDKKLNRAELMEGIADGLEEGATLPQDLATMPPELLETHAALIRRHRRADQQQEQQQEQEQEQDQAQEQDQEQEGANAAQQQDSAASRHRFQEGILDSAVGGVKTILHAGARAVRGVFNKVLGLVDKTADGCVMCQYIVERCEGNVKQSGVLPGMAAAEGFGSYLEVESSALPANDRSAQQSGQEGDSLLEVDQFYGGAHAAANIIGSARQSTRVQRQLERQKYNEIYRVVDITLDDVCEQGMPNSFYGFCKQIYKVQSDVVDGLRYQYRPADICFRIGMCGKGSYITKGMHSRYKTK